MNFFGEIKEDEYVENPTTNVPSIENNTTDFLNKVYNSAINQPLNNQTNIVRIDEEIEVLDNSSEKEESIQRAATEISPVNKPNISILSNDDNESFGRIISINNNIVGVSLQKKMLELPNILNVHVSFRYKDENIIGEVIKTETDYIEVNIIGEIRDKVFITGLSHKPNYNSRIRIINLMELTAMFGDQELNNTEQVRLGSSIIYDNYKINVGINSFFSNHFAIMGNTGSGKSCTFARIVQNVFTNSTYLPLNVNIFLFDAYGEYNSAFSNIRNIDSRINYKSYTTNTLYPDTEVLKIPLWLLGVDDIALLLNATESAQLPIIEKALKLVPILKGTGPEVAKYKNDIISRALLDILKSGKDASLIRNQITAVLTTVQTEQLKLDAPIHQTGYDRTIRQCIYVDNSGKIQEMELLVAYLSSFVIENFTLPNPSGTVPYTLNDLKDALDFALLSEGILKSDKVFDYANILSVRLHSLVGSEAAKYFEYDKLITRNGYIGELLTTFDNKKAQIVNFNINYVDDRMAKNITKIISKMLFEFAAENKERGSIPFHIIIEEAHRYVQKDSDANLLGYNIFERITKEGRKYGVILGLITQRPSELSETCISQCSNFIILRTQHPKDLSYIKQMVPNFSEELVSFLRILQPGNAIAFGSAFKVAVAVKLEKPVPEPYSRNSDIARIWYAKN